MLPLYSCRKVVNGWTCAVEIRNDIGGELGSFRSFTKRLQNNTLILESLHTINS
jgi:hypothetical protein